MFSMLSHTFQTNRLIAVHVIDRFCKVCMRVKCYALCLKLLHLPYEALCHTVVLTLCGHNGQNIFVFIILGQQIVQGMTIEMKYLQLLVTFLTLVACLN